MKRLSSEDQLLNHCPSCGKKDSCKYGDSVWHSCEHKMGIVRMMMGNTMG